MRSQTFFLAQGPPGLKGRIHSLGWKTGTKANFPTSVSFQKELTVVPPLLSNEPTCRVQPTNYQLTGIWQF